MKNPELRKAIIEDGTLKQYRKIRNELIRTHAPREPNGNFSPEQYKMDPFLVKECENARQSASKQRKIIEDHIRWLIGNAERLGNDLFFGTWTFNDKALELKPRTRRETIGKIIGKLEDYILNIDYGKENGREHYHGIIAVKRGTYDITEMVWSDKYKSWLLNIDILDKYKLGYYDLQAIKTNYESEKKLARYITKLTQHSIKEKQSYVSVKKGSAYQEWKKERRYNLVTHQQYTSVFMEQQAELYINSEECPF